MVRDIFYKRRAYQLRQPGGLCEKGNGRIASGTDHAMMVHNRTGMDGSRCQFRDISVFTISINT
jgi:hypothetical protein